MLRAIVVALFLFASGGGLAAGAPAAPQAPPPNDDLAGAAVIASLPFGHRQNTREATAEGGEVASGCQQDAGRSVWFRYTPAQDGRVRFSTAGSRFDGVLSVWLGSGHPLQQLACDVTHDTARGAAIGLNVSQGITYLVKVESVGFGGDLLLYAHSADQPPANDNLAAAELIGSLPFRHQALVARATREAGEVAASGCAGTAQHGVWYRYVPQSDGLLRLDLDAVGANMVPAVSVWVGSGHPLRPVACRSEWFNARVTLTLRVIAGRSYFIRAEPTSPFSDDVPDTALVALNAYTPPPPAANDDLANALPIAELPYEHALDSAEATTEPGELNGPCASGDERHGLWFNYVAAEDGRVPIRVGDAQFDAVVSVWQGTDHPLVPVTCSDSVEQSDLLMQVTAGQTYQIKVESAGGAGGRARLVLGVPRPIPPRPANDDLAQAMPIDALPFAHSMDNTEASAEPREATASCASYATGAFGLWYRYTAVDAGRLRLHSAGSDVPTVVSVWQGSRHPLRELACGWALTGEVDRDLTVSVRPGQTYLIRVEGYSLAVGALQLHALAPPPPPGHDDLARALDVPGLPFTHDTDLAEASSELDEVTPACGYGTRRGVWYRLRPEMGGRVPIRAEGSRGQVVVSAWLGASHPLQPISCSSDAANVPLRLDVVAGMTYYVKVEAASEVAGPVHLDMGAIGAVPPRPANDDLADAMPIPGLPFAHEVDSAEATTEPNELAAGCGYGASRHGVWYRYQPTAAGRVPIRLERGTVDTVVSAWTGQAHPLQIVTCSRSAIQEPLVLEVAAGVTYFIKVDDNAERGGLVRLALDEMAPIPPPPPNDNLADAAVISALPYAADVDTTFATFEPGEIGGPCYATDRLGVWYRYHATSDGRLPIQTAAATFDEVVSVWIGEDHPLAAVACSNGTDTAPLLVDVSAGETYLIKVEGLYGGTGRLRIAVSDLLPPPVRPANNDLADALAIARLPFEHEVVTDEATTEPGEEIARCDGWGGMDTGHGVWFRYTPADSGRLRLHAAGSTYAPVISVWQGARHPLRQLACKADVGGDLAALTIPVRAGRTYLIKAEGVFGGRGRLVLHAVTPPAPPANDDLAGAVAFATLPFSDTVSTDEATVESFEATTACGEPSTGSAWYRYNPASSGPVSLRSLGGVMRASVWVGSGHPLRELLCAGSLGARPDEELRLPTDAGTDYFIMIENVSAAEGKLPTLSVTAAVGLANDDLAQAVAIGALPFTDRSGPIARATWEPGEAPPSCGGAIPGGWYRYTAAADSRLRLNTLDAGNETGLLSVWTGAGHPLTEVACAVDPSISGLGRTWTVDVRAGETYYVRTAPLWVGSGTEVVVNAIEAPPRPANDGLARATSIDSLPFQATVDLAEASLEPGEAGPSCGSAETGSVWYRYIPPVDGRLRLGLTNQGGEAVMSVWRGEAHPLAEVVCERYPSDLAVVGGVTYYVRLSPAWPGTAGIAVIEVSPPPPPAPNDDLAQATGIGELPFTDRVNTSGATTEPGELASPCDAAGGKSVWYRLTLPETTHLRLDTRTSGFDTVLSVWTGTGHPLRLLLCNDDEVDTSASALTFTAEGGTTYIVRIDGLNGESGDLTLRASVTERPNVGRVYLPRVNR